MSKPIIFCDFDGTVTKKDNIVNIMRQFAPPEWEKWKDDVLSRSVSIQEGVGNMFALLPSSLQQEITRFVLENAVIREGFSEFVQFTKEQRIPLYIVSGGMDFFVNPMLEGFDLISGVFCNEADFSEDKIKIHWPHKCDEKCSNQNCGCCKPAIIRNISKDDTYVIVIGDSVTDLEAAKCADTVIARDYLAEKCEEQSIPYRAFETFYDCITVLEGLLQRDQNTIDEVGEPNELRFNSTS
ncbi:MULTISPECIES: 2-hydroxy-3-keto-5-methylthiopentenyl-1-phosphate phosphatase [Bacillus]|uniref:2-hydroxy-3-keto-5-methylthiopentenyl-1-phosphate phosphatase n=2 Tax=Bacillus TaxID=1386 RepID=A0A0M4GBH0_9BACI|nr:MULTISPECIES: 2-hydroxy-3-keto-5-methylthiopentenyl-1-phosphate phosphatase [Bacillus]ALC83078.1 2-hydroxy-3-keto-5-methylthiopentenyl-1-phosphate phosphatase [Bacillus gobiensis]MBP1082123.1 2-hydroxy-3-keto-5-methylthiopentenyl-1-phosphate phosphatase [Bacillus capparidis]MED1096746.1 2-hydroxy-3-keto-5-methylthiopentenyl-1-phosphate phosphatase [Bacillus capparidis]